MHAPSGSHIADRLHAISRDIRFTTRLVRRTPGPAIAAILILALGIGSNTAVFSVLQTALFNPLGLRDAERIVVAQVDLAKLKMFQVSASGAEYRDLTTMPHVFSAVAATEGRAWTALQSGSAVRLLGRAVTPDYFRVFGERPYKGRFFTAGDRETVVLSYAFWQAQYAGSDSAIGSTLVLDDKPHRIIGIAPTTFRLPANAQAWTELVLDAKRLQSRGNNMNLAIFARLKDGVTADEADRQLQQYVGSLKSAPDESRLRELGYGMRLTPLSHYVAGDLRRPMWLLWAAALAVLATACANVAGLLLARTVARRKEIAIRIALGAGRGRLLGQLFVESLCLGVSGAAAGVLLAVAGIELAKRVPLPGADWIALTRIDLPLLLYALGLSAACSILFGLAPAVQLLAGGLSETMARARRHWIQDLFVTAEVAASLLLVMTTGFLLRSLWQVQQVNPGFDPHRVTTAFVIKPKDDVTFPERLQSSLAALPAVEYAALAYPIPFSTGGLTSTFAIRNQQTRPGQPELHGEAYMVTPDFFQTLRIPLLRGRSIARSDTMDAPVVCVVDAAFASRFFPDEDPIGKEIRMYRGWSRIVGVVATIRSTTLEEAARPTVYYPLSQVPYFRHTALLVRMRDGSVPAIREAVRQANPGVPVYDVKTMNERIRDSIGIRSLLAWLLAAFGGISLVLATAGIQSVISQVIGERTPEIGVRMALGARPGQILSHFLQRGLRSGLIGIALGAAAAIVVQRWLQSLLYQVRPFEPAILLGTTGLLLALLAIAVALPSWRASRMDPQRALRHE